MKVVFVTDSYYPNPSPNAICVGKLCEEFKDRGIETTIIALRTFPQKAKIPEDANVCFVEPDRYYSTWYEINDKKDYKRIRLMQHVFRLRGALYGLFWPLMSLTHLNRYKNKLMKILKQCNDEEIIIVGVYKSLEAALAVAQVKKKCRRAKYILYTLDAISGSNIPTIFGSKSIAKNSISRWEHILFDAYDAIFLMNSHKRTYLNEKYRKYHGKMRFVDIPLLDISNNFMTSNVESEIKHLVFTGSMSKRTADPSYFLSLINEFQDSNIIIDFYGKIFDDEILKAINNCPCAIYHGLLPYDNVAKIQNEAYALLNFGNFTPCGIPCKIFEYFSTGKPIISCFKIDDDASKPYMEKYPNALLIDERKAIDENVENLMSFLNSKFISAKNTIHQLYINNTPAATVDMIISDSLK